MKKWIIGAATVLALYSLPAANSAQARMANPSLAETPLAQSDVQQAHYRSYRHYHGRQHWRRHYNRYGYRHRYRHCWNDRIRVRTPAGYFVWRTHRRCGWRFRYW
ncbi:MAG: hypothetical protein AB7E67_01790 [Xanthobacteraceae bacterium]